MIEHKLTKKDIKDHPELKEQGLNAGDIISLPLPIKIEVISRSTDPDKPRPQKP